MGLLWTIGQTGTRDTDAHLCEFAARYFPAIPQDCQAADWIVSAAGWLFVLAVLVALANLAWIIATWEGWGGRKAAAQPQGLEIHFDPANPAQRFWSFESPRDSAGNKLPGLFHEYRVDVHNPTSRTIRNVAVTVENFGLIGARPLSAFFDKTRAPVCDLRPGCSELAVVLHWPHPRRQPGMAAGPSAIAAYGPLLVTVGADDFPPTQRQFWLDPEREPMLSDRLEYGEEELARGQLTRV